MQAKENLVVRNLKEMSAPLRNGIIFIWLIALNTACGSMKTLDLNELKVSSDNEINVTYAWSIKGHYATIHLDSTEHFKYEFSNGGYQGYRIGTYTLTGNLLTLNSDSLIQKKWSDILAGNKIVSR